jgi:hypothetical protein
MVAYSGTAVCADRLRPLNQPRPVHVETNDRGYPVAVGFGGRTQGKGVAVAEVLDRWRIDDEWWRPSLQGDTTVGRAEISRMYYHVALRNRQLLVIFHDLIEDDWYAQTNATPLAQPEPVQVLTPRLPVAATSGAIPESERAAKLPLRRIGIAAS